MNPHPNILAEFLHKVLQVMYFILRTCKRHSVRDIAPCFDSKNNVRTRSFPHGFQSDSCRLSITSLQRQPV